MRISPLPFGALFLALASACSEPQVPVALGYPVHSLAIADEHALVVVDGDSSREAGAIEIAGDPIPLPTVSDGSDSSKTIELVLPPAIAVAAGKQHACILSTTQVTCWGDNEHGAVGAHRACPRDTTGARTGSCALAPEVMPTLPVIRAIAAGDDVSCAISDADRVYCWGDSAGGRLGGSSVPPLDPPTPVALDTRVIRLVIQHATVCAIDHLQQAWCWGVGYGPTPVRLELDGVVDVAIGRHHACAISARGLECWGANRNGESGDVAFARKCGTTTPVCELSATRIPLDATRVVVGERHSCALTRDGLVACWGSNEVGQLGRDNAFLVGEIGSVLEDATDLVASYAKTCAIKRDDSAWCWGEYAAPSDEP